MYNLKNINNDGYSPDILRRRYKSHRDYCGEVHDIKKLTNLPIRHPNPPEDITENIVKFIIRKYDDDPTCQWAKSIGERGDICSDKYNIHAQPEVKAFTSDGPSSFGPNKKFGVMYFLDMSKWFIHDLFILWKVNVTHESPEWKQIKMNKLQTYEDQCVEGRRPHISWENIHSQIPDKCVKIYEGSFEGIF